MAKTFAQKPTAVVRTISKLPALLRPPQPAPAQGAFFDLVHNWTSRVARIIHQETQRLQMRMYEGDALYQLFHTGRLDHLSHEFVFRLSVRTLILSFRAIVREPCPALYGG